MPISRGVLDTPPSRGMTALLGVDVAMRHPIGLADRSTATRKISFRHHDKLFRETTPKPSRSSGQRRRNPVNRSVVVSIAGGGPPVTSLIGRLPMSKRI